MNMIALRLAILPWLAAVAGAQTPATLPFGIGERLTFTVRSHVGTVGHAVMAVSGPVDVGGTSTMLASFSTKIRVAFMKGSTEGRSWIDPLRMTSLRYVEDERRPFSSARDSVEIDPAKWRWTGLHGDSGVTATNQPLDELSFIYFLRTVTLAPDSLYSFDRFYDQRRIPTTVRVLRHDTLRTSAGNISAVVLEMNVKDNVGRGGPKTIRLWLSDDGCRVPVRIESSLPFLIKGIMTLDSAVTPACSVGPGVAGAERRDR